MATMIRPKRRSTRGGLLDSSIRRLATAVVTVALVAGVVVSTPAPAAAAAHPAPWRFTTVTLNSTISGWQGAEPIKGWVLQCPAGYTAVSGGIVGGDTTHIIWKLLEYPNPADGTYHIVARNDHTNGTTIVLQALCVWLDDVGTITTVYAEFPRNAIGYAGGILRCPAGTTVFSGGVDWSNFSDGRRIDYSTPITDGTAQGTGWYVAGYSDVSGVLGIELRCVASSLLTASYAEAADSPTPGLGYGSATAVCAPGYRVLTGGAGPAGTKNPAMFQGRASLSGPLDARQWPVHAYQGTGVTVRALSLCAPASTASVSFTQTPAALSTVRSGTITFSATDLAGEALTFKCHLDGAQKGCASGVPINYGPLLDGQHHYVVNVRNQSGFDKTFTYGWKVDATVPSITGHTPTTAASLTGPFTITFSEPVDGVTASSVQVHAEAANVDIAGTVARPSTSTATWTPSTRLVPGETYRVSFTTAIHDTAGNPLTATFFTVRAATVVENSSAALQRLWDRDSKTIASGGSYIVSRLAGSRAERTFTATAGQTVSVYGIRMPDGGLADVYLDGVKKATVSFYAATAVRARVYLSPALTAGTHTISIRPLGTKPAASSNSWVAVDNLAVGATVTQETSLTQTFRRVTTTSAYGGSYDSISQSTATDTTPAQFRLTMVGTGFKVYATKTSASGKARVYVDGVLKATINLNSSSTVYQALVYSTTFALGQHAIRIEAVGTSSGATSSVNLDRITVN